MKLDDYLLKSASVANAVNQVIKTCW